MSFLDDWYAGTTSLSPNYKPPASAGAAGTNNFMDTYQNMVQKNVDQYGPLVEAYQKRQTDLSGNLESLGQNQLAQANQYYDQQQAAGVQSAQRRGLGNSTIADSIRQGINSQRDYNINQINNNIAGQRLAYGAQWSGDTLNAIQSLAAQKSQAGMAGGSLGYNYAALAQQQANAAQNANRPYYQPAGGGSAPMTTYYSSPARNVAGSFVNGGGNYGGYGGGNFGSGYGGSGSFAGDTGYVAPANFSAYVPAAYQPSYQEPWYNDLDVYDGLY